MSAAEVFQYTPGINADTYGSNSRSDSYITIRGLPANFFQDNLRLPLTRPYGGYRVDPFMIERLEVLRGPSSVLYGQGGPGGTINYVSKRPTPVPFAMVDMQVGNFEQPRIGMDFGGALNGDGTLSYRMIGVGQNTQLNGGNPFTGQRIALAPSFAWKPDNQTSLIVFGSFLQDDTHIDSDFLPAQGTVLPNPNGRISRRLFTGNTSFDKQIRTQYAIGYEFEHRFNDAFAVRQNLRYATVSTGINTVYGAGINFDDPTFRTINRYAIGGKVGAKAFTLDNQMQADFFLGPTKHTVLVGVDYLNQYSFDQQNFRDGGLLDVFSGIGQPIAPGAPLLLQDQRQTISQVGVYFQDQIKFFDRLVLTGGFRYDSAVNDFKDPVNADSSGVSKDSALSPRIGAVYLFDNGFAPYISYSESSPSIRVPAGSPGTVIWCRRARSARASASRRRSACDTRRRVCRSSSVPPPSTSRRPTSSRHSDCFPMRRICARVDTRWRRWSSSETASGRSAPTRFRMCASSAARTSRSKWGRVRRRCRIASPLFGATTPSSPAIFAA